MKKLLMVVLVFTGIAYAGTNNLPVETDRIIQRSHINKFQTALSGNVVPRNTAGTVADVAGTIGESSYRWDNVFAKRLSLIFGSAGSNAIVLQAPSPVPSPYPLTLPASPPSPSPLPLVMDTTGAVTPAQVQSNGIADGSITDVKRAALNYSGSSTIGLFSTTSTSPVDVTGASINLTTVGRPVVLSFDGGSISIAPTLVGQVTARGEVTCYRTGGISVFSSAVGTQTVDATTPALISFVSPHSIGAVLFLSAGTYTFSCKASVSGANQQISFVGTKLLAYEL